MKMDIIKNYPEDEAWHIGEKEMSVIETAVHMGILRSSSNQKMQAVESNVQKADRTVYILMGTRFHGENSLKNSK